MARPVIEISGLTKYYGKVKGIDNISLSIEEGEIFGFIGPNGAGKSTTIRLLLNLIFPTAGSARIFGMDIIRDTRKIKQFIGYIPSEASAYASMTVDEFLDYSARFYNIPAAEDRKNRLSEILELDLRRHVADLSSGNRRKVAIVQSLMHSPKLLILDEPTTGLDPLMQARFFELLREENSRGTTIFYSSHVLSEIQNLCGRVAIIKDGGIIKLEEIETLRKKQLKRVTVELPEKPGDIFINLPGIINLSPAFAASFAINFVGRRKLQRPKKASADKFESDYSASFMYSGDINDLVKAFTGIKIVNLTIEEPPLEEIFMHYYNRNNG